MTARRTAPVATTSIVAVTLAAYAAELAGGGMTVCERFGFTPAHPTLATALSSLLVHDPDHVVHIAGNMLILAVLGAIVEPVIGHVRFAVLYFASGIAGALFHVAVDPHSSDALVGCSGAIAGIMAVLGVLRPRLLGFVAGFVLLNVYWAWTGTAGSVSFATHLGGFTCGAATVLLARTHGVRRVIA